MAHGQITGGSSAFSAPSKELASAKPNGSELDIGGKSSDVQLGYLPNLNYHSPHAFLKAQAYSAGERLYERWYARCDTRGELWELDDLDIAEAAAELYCDLYGGTDDRPSRMTDEGSLRFTRAAMPLVREGFADRRTAFGDPRDSDPGD